MRNLMALRYQIVITFCLITIISTGCAATYQNVDAALLEQNKSKTFKLGIVKAVGESKAGIFGSSGIEYKKKALENVPISEICSILSSKYSITIDATVDKTSKAVKEARDGYGPPSGGNRPGVTIIVHPTIDNAYYGNLEYDNASILGILIGFSRSQIINNKDFPDVVNVTYSVEHGFKETYHYDINISSSGQEILKAHGIVGSVTTPGSTLLDSPEACWNSYVDYAGRISEALKRDLLEAANKTAQPPQAQGDLVQGKKLLRGEQIRIVRRLYHLPGSGSMREIQQRHIKGHRICPALGQTGLHPSDKEDRHCGTCGKYGSGQEAVHHAGIAVGGKQS